jgi:phosphohistidine swiveling domain-containing protein
VTPPREFDLWLRQLVRDGDWVIGAINYDEDLHFSSYYLRASLHAHPTHDHPGYSFVVATYEDFTERYYLLRDECIATAAGIVQRALESPTWLSNILANIITLADRLGGVFPASLTPVELATLDNSELLALYRSHHRLHSELYVAARVPEALDRGVSWYSIYLKEYLRELGVDNQDLDGYFADLTQPTTISVLTQELADFEAICDIARDDPSLATVARAYPRRSRLLLPPQIQVALREHWETWRFMSYHGYGRREPQALGEYTERLINDLGETGARSLRVSLIKAKLTESAQRRDELMADLGIDEAHRRLFRAFPEIGAVKLHRRYAQLRNFYYLDMLLSEIAVRLGCDEWTLRCLLPDEVDQHLDAGDMPSVEMIARKQGCMYVLAGDREEILTGAVVREVRALLEEKTRPKRERKVLKGVVASQGRVVGTCKIMIRAGDETARMERGAVMVSEATDPDLLQFLRIAGAVLTEQGGVSSHAALVCRELGIPAIIGIEGLLDSLEDGDVVEVDATSGEVRIVEARATEPPIGLVYDGSVSEDARRVGAKALNLLRAQEAGALVPETLVLNYAGLASIIDTQDNDAIARMTGWINEHLDHQEGQLAIRSSALDEDGQDASLAGAYESIIGVARSDLSEAFVQFVRKNRERAPDDDYEGSVIVQPAIEAEYGGVCLTADHRLESGNAMLIEIATGGAQSVTAGLGVPHRLVVDRDTGDVLRDEGPPHGLGSAGVNIDDLRHQALALERHFGCVIDIEWVVADSVLYVLQVRPVVGQPDVSR